MLPLVLRCSELVLVLYLPDLNPQLVKLLDAVILVTSIHLQFLPQAGPEFGSQHPILILPGYQTLMLRTVK